MKGGHPRCSRLLPCLLSLLGACQSPASEPYRVLFVGNSRIYYYNQPAILEQIARANGHEVATRMIVEGGATLEDLIGMGALDSLRTGGWDAVVVNEQSTWGLTRFVEGLARVPEAPDGFFARVNSFARAADEIGACLVLIAHPRHQDMPLGDGDALIRGFHRAASAHPRTEVVPLEVGWRIAVEREPHMDLYDPDGNHPTRVGALLSAIQIYQAIFGEVPAMIPMTINGPWVELGDGTLLSDSVVELVSVDASTVRALQSIASEAARQWPLTVSRLQGGAASDPGQPALAAADKEFDAELHGRWVGALRLYPRFLGWPSTMVLDVGRSESRWTTDLRVSFTERPEVISYSGLPMSDEGAYLQFVDPDGPNGGIVRYRIVPSGDSIIGIAEFLTDVDLYGIGSLSLQRSPQR